MVDDLSELGLNLARVLEQLVDLLDGLLSVLVALGEGVLELLEDLAELGRGGGELVVEAALREVEQAAEGV